MDVALIAIAMHGLERLLAVLFGGLAVYFGFRLFLALPTQTRSDGKIDLPGFSVVLAKAGPGLFFVAFGVAVIVTSLLQPIKVKTEDVDYSGVTGKAAAGATQSAKSPATTQSAAQDVARVQLALQSINCMQRLASAKAKGLDADLDQAAREAKLAMLVRVWDNKAWGDFDTFNQWASGRTGVTASAARALFDGERSDCPR